MQPWRTNWDLPLRGRQLLFYDLRSVYWNSNYHLDTCLWCGSIWFTYVIRWYTYYAIIHPNHVHKCLPLDDCCTDPQRWATRASPPPSRRPPAPTEPAACLPPQNAIRCKIFWSLSILKKKSFSSIFISSLYLLVPPADIPLPSNGLRVRTLAGSGERPT